MGRFIFFVLLTSACCAVGAFAGLRCVGFSGGGDCRRVNRIVFGR